MNVITVFHFSCLINWSVKLMSHLFDAINMMMKRYIDNEKDMLQMKFFDIVSDVVLLLLLLFLLQYILWHFLSSLSLDISIRRSVRNSISSNWYHQTLFCNFYCSNETDHSNQQLPLHKNCNGLCHLIVWTKVLMSKDDYALISSCLFLPMTREKMITMHWMSINIKTNFSSKFLVFCNFT